MQTGETTTQYTQQYQYQYQLPTTTQTTTTYTTTATTAIPTATTYTTGIPATGPRPKPVFKLFRQGSGISPHEQQGIVSTAMAIYQSGLTPISNQTAKAIKKAIGGDWIVIVYGAGKPIDFNMTCVQGNDYMYFTLDNLAYQVCRLSSTPGVPYAGGATTIIPGYTTTATTAIPTTTTTETTYTTTAIPTTTATTYTTSAATAIPTTTTTIPTYTTTEVTAVPTTTTTNYTIPTTVIPELTTTATTAIPTTTTTTYTTTETTAIPTYGATATTYTTGIPATGPRPTPVFKLFRQGSGISPHEQQGIVSTAMAIYQSGLTPISNQTAKGIKRAIGGDWIVIVYGAGKPIDFNMTCVQGNDYMYFTLDNLAYQVCRLR